MMNIQMESEGSCDLDIGEERGEIMFKSWFSNFWPKQVPSG